MRLHLPPAMTVARSALGPAAAAPLTARCCSRVRGDTGLTSTRLAGRYHSRPMTTCLQSSGRHHDAAICAAAPRSSRPSLPFSSVSVSWPARPSTAAACCAFSSASAPRSKTPTLNSTLRRFYFLVHPDLFHSHPLHRSVNEANLQHFLGFVTAMKQTSSAEPWPPARHTNLTFYIRRKARDGLNTQLSFIDYCEQRERGKKAKKTPAAGKRGVAQAAAGGAAGGGGRHEDSEFHVLRVTLSTNGGSCKAMVERQLRHLFCMAALPEEFEWDDEYWQQKAPISKADAEADEERGWGFDEDGDEQSAQRERDRA